MTVKCRPLYSLREFSIDYITGVYIQPQANPKLALEQLHVAVSKQQDSHPEEVFIVAGDFNQANLRSVLPNFYHNINCPTRGEKTLDHVYTNVNNDNKAVVCPHRAQSNHHSLLMLPGYKPLISRTVLLTVVQ